MITVALIDDHLIVRSGFAQLLGLEPDLQVVAEFGSGARGAGGAAGARCAGVYLRYLHARYLRSGAAKPAAERYGDDYALRS